MEEQMEDDVRGQVIAAEVEGVVKSRRTARTMRGSTTWSGACASWRRRSRTCAR